MYHGIRLERNRSVTGCAVSRKFDAPRDLLHGLDRRVFDLSALPHDSSAFGKTVFGIDFVEVLIHHKSNAEPRSSLLASLKQKNHITIQRNVQPFQRQRGHESSSNVVFV